MKGDNVIDRGGKHIADKIDGNISGDAIKIVNQHRDPNRIQNLIVMLGIILKHRRANRVGVELAHVIIKSVIPGYISSDVLGHIIIIIKKMTIAHPLIQSRVHRRCQTADIGRLGIVFDETGHRHRDENHQHHRRDDPLFPRTFHDKNENQRKRQHNGPHEHQPFGPKQAHQHEADNPKENMLPFQLGTAHQHEHFRHKQH